MVVVRYSTLMQHGSNDKKNVVIVGGGTGTHTLLRGLKQYQKQISLRAIVTMADAGGSTGRLRDEFGYLPVGDVRMALVALASNEDEHEALVRQLFLHRFDKGDGLSGHNIGNLLLVALTDILGSEEAAISAASRVLRVEGEVLPVTTESVHLVARYTNGTQVVGEHIIDEPAAGEDATIETLSLTPAAAIHPRAEAAILDADMVILGPGDLYTSVVANCVVDGVADALRHSNGKVVFVTNLMTKRGQTSGMGTREHVEVLSKYTSRQPDHVLVNTGVIDEDLLGRYAKEKEFPVAHNLDDSRVVADDFLARDTIVTEKGDTLRRSLVRHDTRKVARVLMDILKADG